MGCQTGLCVFVLVIAHFAAIDMRKLSVNSCTASIDLSISSTSLTLQDHHYVQSARIRLVLIYLYIHCFNSVLLFPIFGRLTASSNAHLKRPQAFSCSAFQIRPHLWALLISCCLKYSWFWLGNAFFLIWCWISPQQSLSGIWKFLKSCLWSDWVPDLRVMIRFSPIYGNPCLITSYNSNCERKLH